MKIMKLGDSLSWTLLRVFDRMNRLGGEEKVGIGIDMGFGFDGSPSFKSEELGAAYFSTRKSKEELKKIKREIVTLKSRLKNLEAQKTILEQQMKT